MSSIPALGHFGVFTSLSRIRRSTAPEVARQAEISGFGTLWVADTRGDHSFLEECVESTETLTIATAVSSIWDIDAHDAAAQWAAIPGNARVLVGLGVSHPATVSDGRYDRPLHSMRTYLETLDSQNMPARSRIVGANGPKMTQLAGAHSLGAVTQMATPERIAEHRRWLGTDAFLAAEVKIVLGEPRTARDLARKNLSNYLGLPSYRKNLRASGFEDKDFEDNGSDLLIDSLVAGPDVDGIRRRVAEYFTSGADHVCLHVLSPDSGVPLDAWHEVAEMVGATTQLRS